MLGLCWILLAVLMVQVMSVQYALQPWTLVQYLGRPTDTNNDFQ